MLTIYKFLMNLLYLLAWPIVALKSRSTGARWQQRRGLAPDSYLPRYIRPRGCGGDEHPVVWAHASSMGEVRVLSRLMTSMLELKPRLRFCVSTYTETGQRLARELFERAEAVFYFPIDAFLPLHRIFKHFCPDAIIIVETEIWPYFIDFCGKNSVPLVLVNGRISEKSYLRYRWFRPMLRSIFRGYRKFAMQSDVDARKIINIGADREKVIVTGNIKHDLSSESDAKARRSRIRNNLGIEDNKIFFVAASTRPGEEEIICRALRNVAEFPDRLIVMMAPRHLERLDEVISTLDEHTFAFWRFSRLESTEDVSGIILMDKMGYLVEMFYGADLSFVGGTLADFGGHNLMEPVIAGVPVLFGPSVYNVQDAADRLIADRLGLMINDAHELETAITKFVTGQLVFNSINSDVWSQEDSMATEKTARIITEELEL